MLSISQNSLWLVFTLALTIFAVVSLILFYHWWRYRSGNTAVIVAGAIYLAVSALFVVLAFTALMAPNQL